MADLLLDGFPQARHQREALLGDLRIAARRLLFRLVRFFLVFRFLRCRAFAIALKAARVRIVAARLPAEFLDAAAQRAA